MTIYNGYTKDLSPEEKRKNEIESIKSILRENPNNEYWQNRLAALTDEPQCTCYEYQGDNAECQVHGHAQDEGSETSMIGQLEAAGFGQGGVM